MSTPASPTPLTEDGDDLLLELRGFLTRMSSGPAAGTVFKTVFRNEHQFYVSLLLDWRSIDLSSAREKEGHFNYKNSLSASKRDIYLLNYPNRLNPNPQ